MNDIMPGGRFAAPIRRGDTVERSGGNANTRALLHHFEVNDFTLAPRHRGFTPDGNREVLTFIEGQTAYPPFTADIRSDKTLVSVAGAIRAMHDATAGFSPPQPAAWQALEVALPVDIDCIGHRDLGPWNFIFDATRVVGVIDWDFAGPSSRAWDLAYAAHHFVPFHATNVLPAWGWDSEPDRSKRLRMFVEAYDGGFTPDEIVDLAIVRMTSIAAHIESRVRAGDAAFDSHRVEGHARGYRDAARFIMDKRSRLLGSGPVSGPLSWKLCGARDALTHRPPTR